MNETAELHGAPVQCTHDPDNASIRHSNHESAHYEEIVLRALPSFVIVLDIEQRVIDWNDAAARTFGLSLEQVAGKTLPRCEIPWDIDAQSLSKIIAENNKVTRMDDIPYTRPDGKSAILGMSIIPFDQDSDNHHLQCFVIGTDITKRKSLESQLGHAQRMESIGHLAAGVAHEINTPVQYVGDNTRFLSDSFNDMSRLLEVHQEIFAKSDNEDLRASVDKLRSVSEDIDLDFLVEEIPAAIEQSQSGLQQVGEIVKAMKQFAHPGNDEMVEVNLNEAVANTITVTRNEWKYDAELISELDPDLPVVPCLASELNQVILNLIVNASHAIRDKKEQQPGWTGTITVRTKALHDQVEFSVSDDGTGIEPEHQAHVFDHFFTTKEIGKGTGQGLSIAYSVIKDKHCGELYFETLVGEGTTFFVRLPLHASGTNEKEHREH